MVLATPGCSIISHGGDDKKASSGGAEGNTWYDTVKQSKEQIGNFKNPYKANPDLAGLEIYQKPTVDNALVDNSVYIGKHPGTINYHFWSGRILNVLYSPDGKVLERQWWHHSDTEEPGYLGSWEMVDFALGSDPDFSIHHDPRNAAFLNERR